MPRTLWFIAALFLLIGCQPAAPTPPAVPSVTPIPTRPISPIEPTPAPTATPARPSPTLSDFWDDAAHFVVEIEDTGLPMGESDTIIMPDGAWWSYVHASQRSAGVQDSCGQPVEFPGCVVIYKSSDGGQRFTLASPATCLFACMTCPCDEIVDMTQQQQYPRVIAADIDGDGGHAGDDVDDDVGMKGRAYYMVYEHGANILLRRSADGTTWSEAEQLLATGIWNLWYRPCAAEESIGQHPFVPYDYECLSGGPPGVYVDAKHERIYIFVAMGQNPGHLGCFVGALNEPGTYFSRCRNNPLITGASDYGPLAARGAGANAYFDFRTISSAEVLRIGDHYYAFYEGIRGPGPGDPGDAQFGLGLARSTTAEIDGPWEKLERSPLLLDLPGNIGLGHADVVIDQGVTYLYTSLDGVRRSRLQLVWR